MTTPVAIITGGSRGIGAAIAKRLAKDGFDIAITYARNAEAARHVTSAIDALGRKALAIQSDSGNVTDNADLVKKVVDAFGRLDVLVCNAGAYPYGGPDTITIEDISRTLDLNMRGVMVESVCAARAMQKGGRIILIGSAFGERVPLPGISIYSATKAGLVGFAKGLSRDLGPKGITVNVVQPGPIDTEMNPADGPAGDALRAVLAIPKYGEAADVADLVSFLASDSTSYITGTALSVDGGLTA
ncbi:SDR family NAD(P)-dependent oxidoreductase [Acetobacter fallax]|uniref:SDR family oxidoreductase n=1 Tax=Acetobacter fallax TaxID=1737473 RepID=A0ABX0K8M4_9PROT|nr:SDR family oxidoreductase [Acetobacter fallax]NHO32719.1 SDR family oxidoreductase [Acetobacter fallax]NHO36221.1 SDR family oxidoreductase [Acetobacter fallax]